MSPLDRAADSAFAYLDTQNHLTRHVIDREVLKNTLDTALKSLVHDKEVIERVASSLAYRLHGKKYDRPPKEIWDEFDELLKSAYRDEARAGLAALTKLRMEL